MQKLAECESVGVFAFALGYFDAETTRVRQSGVFPRGAQVVSLGRSARAPLAMHIRRLVDLRLRAYRIERDVCGAAHVFGSAIYKHGVSVACRVEYLLSKRWPGKGTLWPKLLR